MSIIYDKIRIYKISKIQKINNKTTHPNVLLNPNNPIAVLSPKFPFILPLDHPLCNPQSLFLIQVPPPSIYIIDVNSNIFQIQYKSVLHKSGSISNRTNVMPVSRMIFNGQEVPEKDY